MSLQLSIDCEFLDKLDPPSSFPPTEEELTAQLQSRFLSECQRFISNERTLYRCSKAVQARLTRLLTSSQDIQRRLASQRDKMDFIAHELSKLKEHETTVKERERVLGMLCELVRMQDLRKDLLLGEKREALEVQPKPIIIDEAQYLQKLQKLTHIIKQSQSLTHLKGVFPLVKEIVLQLQIIASSAHKLIAKKLLTPRMVELIFGQFNILFDKDGEVMNAVTAQRLQNLRIGLTAMINNLNYATNTSDLYASIFENWASLLEKEISLFNRCKRSEIVRSINSQLMADLLPKMEKSIFKVKQLVSIERIRKAYSGFIKNLSKLFPQAQRQDFTLLSLTISKCDVLISSRLSEQSQILENSKYNIYTMASYIPIRQHLQKIRQCYDNSVQGEKIDWQVGFYNLCSSRDPKNYPNNKSLLIFNLNIWYLYLKLIPNGIHRVQGEQLLKWCSATFTSINVQEARKKYYDSFEKVLQLCANLPAFKATLYAELNLLGHQDLRRQISKQIRLKYVETYEETLAKIQQAPMTNEQTKTFCQARKINLNKFGKHSHAICVLSPAALNELLENP